MASSPAFVISRSVQHLLRRHAAALFSVSGNSLKSVTGRPLPLTPTPEDPISNLGFSTRPLDLALLGRFDWPVMAASERVDLFAKKSDDEDYSDDDDSDGVCGDDFDSDEFDDGDVEDEDEDLDDEVLERPRL